MVNKDCGSFDFQSRSLHLDIKRYGEDSIEIVLVNRNYVHQKYQKLKHLLILLILFGIYSLLAKFGAHHGFKALRRTWTADIGFFVYLFYSILSTLRIVKREKLLFCHKFAMQLETERFFPRTSSTFISASSIYDIRLSEVIENLDIHYTLIVRTKGELFQEKPIITLFNAQRPPINCLELIYKNINMIMYNKSETATVRAI